MQRFKAVFPMINLTSHAIFCELKFPGSAVHCLVTEWPGLVQLCHPSLTVLASQLHVRDLNETIYYMYKHKKYQKVSPVFRVAVGHGGAVEAEPPVVRGQRASGSGGWNF